MKILTRTPDGISLVESHGIAVKITRGGGATHEFWKHELRAALEPSGGCVEEYLLENGRTADLRGSGDCDADVAQTGLVEASPHSPEGGR